MAASKTKPGRSKHAPDNEKRIATMQSNASLDIDFEAGLPRDQLASQRSVRSSIWVDKLNRLYDAIEAGEAEADTMYPIGTFTTPGGARAVIRKFERNPHLIDFAADFESTTRPDPDGDGRISELWAGIPSAASLEADA